MADADGSGPLNVPAEPLFVVDLSGNGGLFAPTTAEVADAFVDRELQFWEFLPTAGAGYTDIVNQSINHLRAAKKALTRFRAGGEGAQDRLRDVALNLERAFVEKRLPHSTSAIGLQIATLKAESPRAAAAFCWALTPNSQPEQFQFVSGDPEA